MFKQELSQYFWKMKMKMKITFRTLSLCISVIILTFLFAVNPNELSHGYGNQDGTYADSGDSFSESLIRNSVIDNLLPNDRYYFGGYISKGLGDGDYGYYPEDSSYYYTSMLLQTVVITRVVELFSSYLDIDSMFVIFRIISAFLISLFLTILCLSAASTIISSKVPLYALPCLFFLSGFFGLMIFAQNIYFFIFSLFLPALLVNAINTNKMVNLFFGILVTNFFVFARGYEFIAIPLSYAILFFALKVEKESMRTKFFGVFVISSAYVMAFILSSLLHLYLIIKVGHVDTIQAAMDLKFKTFSTRILTFEPEPLSRAFFVYFNNFLNADAFNIGLIKFNGFQFIAVYLCFCVVALYMSTKTTLRSTLILAVFPFLTCFLSYTLSYQHLISHHFMYSWLVISTSFAIPTCSFLMLLSVKLIGLYTKR